MLLSLADVDRRNPSGPRHKRYFCPLCQAGGGKTPDLSVDRSKGIFHCFKCGAGGVLAEFQVKKAPRRARWKRPIEVEDVVKEISEDYVARCSRDFAGSPADDYERSRGIDGVKTRMGYDPAYPFLVGDEWTHEPAAVFFFEDAAGRVVARQGRLLRKPHVDETSKITFGKISQGVFNSRALAQEEVIVCEGPNTAAALVERGYPAIALGGKTAHDWLLDALAGKRVWIGLDNDEPGRKAANELLEALRSRGGDASLLLPPGEGQDWNDVLGSDPSFVLPDVVSVGYEPGLVDLQAFCRRRLRYAKGEVRELLEDWDFALDRGFEPARAWWRRYGGKLTTMLSTANG